MNVDYIYLHKAAVLHLWFPFYLFIYYLSLFLFFYVYFLFLSIFLSFSMTFYIKNIDQSVNPIPAKTNSRKGPSPAPPAWKSPGVIRATAPVTVLLRPINAGNIRLSGSVNKLQVE